MLILNGIYYIYLVYGMDSFSCSAKIRLWSNGRSPACWHFVTVEKQISQQIATSALGKPRKGRGSVKVEARIGFYSRKTSIFPDKKSGCYLLPIKFEVRKALQIADGDEVFINLTLL